MKSAVVENYRLAIVLPEDHPAPDNEDVFYEADWGGLIRNGAERKLLEERLNSLKERGIMPIVTVFAPRERR